MNDGLEEAVLELARRHEDDRFKCEVRHLLAAAASLKRWDEVKAYLGAVGKRRGVAAERDLAAAVKQQWRAGNRGEKGEWR